MTSGRNLPALVLPVVVTILVVSFVAKPDISFDAAVKGLKLWWEVVVPALLPFFVGGQILMGLGVVHFMGVLLEPPMRPLFNLPGIAGFVCAMGLASGYPIGAVLTAKLREENAVTEAEGERLVSFANTADPLFMAGAVAVGMFGSAGVAGTLIAAHYIGAVATGFVLRFWRPTAPASAVDQRKGGILSRAYQAMVEARSRDGRPFGQLFGDCIRDSMNTLLLVGGFIIMFAVVTEILRVAGVVEVIGGFFGLVLLAFGVDPGAGSALVAGLFEITLGSQLASEANAPLSDRLVVASAIIGWAGLSVHAQVAAILQGTGISMVPYVGARLLHGLFAGVATAILLLPGVDLGWLPVVPALAMPGVAPMFSSIDWWDTFIFSGGSFLLTVGLIGIGAILVGIVFTIRNNIVFSRL